MHRLLVKTDLLNDEKPSLSADAARHLKVLRPKMGEKIELFDGRGNWRVYVWDCGLSAASSVFTLSADSRPPLTLFACITKGARWDWTIEKATEMGVTRIVPVVSARTIVRIPADERAVKRARWMRIAEEAARQSDAKWLPEITEAVDFADVLAYVEKTTCFVGALTEPPPPPLAAAIDGALRAHGPGGRHEFAVFVGPEGDFTPEELAALLKIATPASFGPTVLRAETAAIFAASVLSALLR